MRCSHHLNAAERHLLSMHKAKSNWLGLPAGISRRIRFMQMQALLQTALDARPKAEVSLDICQVAVTFDIQFGSVEERRTQEYGDDYVKNCSIIYDWEEDCHEWFEDDNAWGVSTYREADGTVYEVDQHTARFGYPNALKMTIMRVTGQL